MPLRYSRVAFHCVWETLVTLPPEWLPHYTVGDYRHWEGDWELIEGIPFAMTPSATYLHQRAAVRIVTQLEQQLESCPACTVVFETDWIVAEDTVVRPDVAVFCERVEGPYPRKPPRLVVEVLSDSTRRKDEGLKRALYAAHGVPHYLLVDPDVRRVQWLVLRGDQLEIREHPGNDVIPLDLGPCRVTLDPSRFWG